MSGEVNVKNERVLVIDSGFSSVNSSGTVAIAFEYGKIVEFIRQPNEYKVQDFVEWMKDEYNRYEIVIASKYGFGLAYVDSLGENRENSLCNKFDLSRSYMTMEKCLCSYKSEYLSKKIEIDFNILEKQLINIETIVNGNGGLLLKRKDNETGVGFLYCLLGYNAYMNDIYQ